MYSSLVFLFCVKDVNGGASPCNILLSQSSFMMRSSHIHQVLFLQCINPEVSHPSGFFIYLCNMVIGYVVPTLIEKRSWWSHLATYGSYFLLRQQLILLAFFVFIE